MDFPLYSSNVDEVISPVMASSPEDVARSNALYQSSNRSFLFIRRVIDLYGEGKVT
jgi:hypothetical protein